MKGHTNQPTLPTIGSRHLVASSQVSSETYLRPSGGIQIKDTNLRPYNIDKDLRAYDNDFHSVHASQGKRRAQSTLHPAKREPDVRLPDIDGRSRKETAVLEAARRLKTKALEPARSPLAVKLRSLLPAKVSQQMSK